MIFLIAGFPTALGTMWSGAAYQEAITGLPFEQAFTYFLVSGFPRVAILGIALVYAIERWVIGDRVKNQAGWVFIRIVLHTLVGILLAVITQLGLEDSPLFIPQGSVSISYVQMITTTGLMAMLVTSAEQALLVMEEREEKLQATIDELNIKIVAIQHEQELAEITETEFFKDLQEKARQQKGLADDGEA